MFPLHFPIECAERICRENVHRECAERMCRENVQRECAERISRKNVQRECALVTAVKIVCLFISLSLYPI